jgi:hypothetical protein
MWVAGKRMAVFCIKGHRGGTTGVRAGTAGVNRDGSLNVSLDVLPIDGKLHVREAPERRTLPPRVRTEAVPPDGEPVLAAVP